MKRFLLYVYRKFTNLRFVQKGQVDERSELGLWLSHLSSLPDTTTIVEIGTWNGRGSTRVITKSVQGSFKKFPDRKVRVIGYEINPAMHAKARRANSKFEFIEIILGSLIEVQQLDSEHLSPQEKIWFEQDSKFIKASQNVFSTIPESIDLLLLDGGEFSTYSEYQVLEARIDKWLLLDDTHTRKCKKIVSDLEGSEKFIAIFKSDERNGVAGYLRVAR